MVAPIMGLLGMVMAGDEDVAWTTEVVTKFVTYFPVAWTSLPRLG